MLGVCGVFLRCDVRSGGMVGEVAGWVRIGSERVIYRSYPPGEVSEAMRYFGGGGVQGKVVITV